MNVSATLIPRENLRSKLTWFHIKAKGGLGDSSVSSQLPSFW